MPVTPRRAEFHQIDAGNLMKPEDSGRPTLVRYRVLGAACALAVVTYILRVGFSTVSPKLEAALDLDSGHVGILMAAFMVGYGLFEMPWGYVADRIGVRGMLVVVASGGALTTLAVALVGGLPRYSSAPLIALASLRFLFGMFQAGTFPGISRMLADWMPTSDRGTAQGVIWTSSRVGGSLAPLLLTPFFKTFRDWSTPLAIASSLGLAWCLLFWPWFRNRPEQSALVNDAERREIAAGRPAKAEKHGPVPWGRMIRSGNVWALCLMYGCLGYSGNFFLTLLPKYLTKYRGLSDDTTKWMQSLPFLGGIAACFLGGWVSDRWIRRTGDRRWGRRMVGMVGMSLAATALFSSVWADSTPLLGLLLCLTFFGNDLTMAPAWASATEIGESYAGVVSGAMNMTSSLFAAVGALVAGHLFEAGNLRLPFYIYAGCYALGVACWLQVDVSKPLASKPLALDD